MIWANLIHLSYNFWFDCPPSALPAKHHDAIAQPRLRFDDRLWTEIIQAMAQAGMNMVVLDLGDGVRYSRHPEIAVRHAWSLASLRRELARLRDHGLEPIPKLNFSAAHDAWLDPYERQLSTAVYYRVCRDLIAEVIELFDHPRFFHLGMDEETAVNQIYNQFAAIRQFDLYWHDQELLFDQVRRGGARPWIWSDYQWYHPAEFARRMPKDVLQSNWWYYKNMSPEAVLARANPQDGNMTKTLRLKPVKAWLELEKLGFDQVPAASTCSRPDNFKRVVALGRRQIASRRLYGFMQTTWLPTLQKYRRQHLDAIAAAGSEIARWR